MGAEDVHICKSKFWVSVYGQQLRFSAFQQMLKSAINFGPSIDSYRDWEKREIVLKHALIFPFWSPSQIVELPVPVSNYGYLKKGNDVDVWCHLTTLAFCCQYFQP